MHRLPGATIPVTEDAALRLHQTKSKPFVGQNQAVPSVRRVQVLRPRNPFEIEIEASDSLVPRTNLLTRPDRLVMEFVNTVRGARLRNPAVGRGEVRSLGVSLVASNPPVTQVVLYLNGLQRYQVFPSGRTVIVKVGRGVAETTAFSPASGPKLLNTNYPGQAPQISAPAPLPAPALEVLFQNGLLSINSDKVSLSEVLLAVHERTGAEIAIPAGADQEMVAADLGPAPAPEVLAHLLNGSTFNFLILSSSSNPGVLERVILSTRPDGPIPGPKPQIQSLTKQPETDDDDEAQFQPKVAARPAAPAANPNPSPEGQVQPAAPDTNTPQNNDVPD